jgi:hypothetical protein
MTLPSIEAARGWSGLTAVDSDDEPLGRITEIYLDRDTGQPEWALVATPQRRRTFVPLAGAARKRDRVAVAVPKVAVSDAPAVRPGRELSDGDAARLRGARGRVPEAGRSGRLRWLVLAGLGSALGMVAVLAGRVRRRRAPTVVEALGRALAELLAAFQAALARGRGRRWFGSLGGPRRRGGRR